MIHFLRAQFFFLLEFGIIFLSVLFENYIDVRMILNLFYVSFWQLIQGWSSCRAHLNFKRDTVCFYLGYNLAFIGSCNFGYQQNNLRFLLHLFSQRHHFWGYSLFQQAFPKSAVIGLLNLVLPLKLINVFSYLALTLFSLLFITATSLTQFFQFIQKCQWISSQ